DHLAIRAESQGPDTVCIRERLADWLSRCPLPYMCCAPAGRGEVLPVGTEADRIDFPGDLERRTERFPSCRLEELHAALVIANQDALAVGTYGDGPSSTLP